LEEKVNNDKYFDTVGVHIKNHSDALNFLLIIAGCINYMFQRCSLILIMLDLLIFYLLG
jgi:hypothetical protein